MKNLNSILGRTTTLLALGAMLSLPASSRATTVSLAVNPSLSSLTGGGWAFAPTIVFGPQNGTGNVDAWTGTITGDLTAGVWTFSGGSSITALLNPAGAFVTPGYGTVSGTDNYGLIAGPVLQAPYGVVTVWGAYRSLTLDLTLGTAVNGSPTTATIGFTGGFLDWSATTGLGPFSGTSTITPGPGSTAVNASAGLVSWDGTTLTLPIQITTQLSANSHETWTGTLVAVIPEPSSVVLALLFGLGLFAAKARGRTRRF